MTVAVVIPWRPGCPHREAALEWTLKRYALTLPGAEVIPGACDPGLPFNRAQAILDGASRTDADVVIVADGDCWSDGVFEALEQVERGEAWAVPHRMLRRLSERATRAVLAGDGAWDQVDMDEPPYKGFETGTLVVIRREVLLDVPPDVRCIGWGQEDQCWSLALRALIGPPWRGTAPCWHLWHPAQPRQSRSIGNQDGLRLLKRYESARHKPAVMRALVDESKATV